ncbi:MAG: hypothetical protein IJS61_02760 [Firmicutes bacterium]|nr:hypothetical protein [Bacillota bacterium]
MNMNLGKNINDLNLTKITGGASGGSSITSITAVGIFTRVGAKLEKCPKCAGSLNDGIFTTDNGRTAYYGQRCTSCSEVFVYGNNIM